MDPALPEPQTSPVAIGRRGMLTRCGMGQRIAGEVAVEALTYVGQVFIQRVLLRL